MYKKANFKRVNVYLESFNITVCLVSMSFNVNEVLNICKSLLITF